MYALWNHNILIVITNYQEQYILILLNDSSLEIKMNNEHGVAIYITTKSFYCLLQ